MRIEHSLDGLRTALRGARPVALAATMGNLHDGHLALVTEARKRAGPHGTVVASIFVNRLQFGVNDDFDKYPRTFDADVARLEAAGCDLLFAPDEAQMYPEPQTFHVVPDPGLADKLEGTARPGHFTGMCTVVMKLFSLVQPDIAVFGKKDYQQLMLVRAMVRQFALPLEVVACEIVREPDGLAMSSRNAYLSKAERAEAVQLSRVLRETADALHAAGRRGALDTATIARLEASAVDALRARGWQPDYVAIRRRVDLDTPDDAALQAGEPLIVLGAARLGAPRLLDNIEV